MHITWYEVLVNIAGFVLLMIPVYFSHMKRGEKWTTAIIGIIILGCSIWKVDSDSEKQDSLTNSIASMNKTVISLPDSIAITNKAISELGLKIDENTGLLKVIDSQLLKKSFTQIIKNITQNPTVSESPIKSLPNTIPSNTIPEQRHLLDSQIAKIKTIPKDYLIEMSYNPDKESAAFTVEIKEKLIEMGYKIKSVSISSMSGYPPEMGFMFSIDHYKKIASIDISELSYSIK